ncbi:MOP flippase family protein [Cohnella sp. AR92]|uniref:MOP flippase family protein n=1 Tax=Cohnella sp. AR92 TaxID=648716 RepID=UPI000F8CB85D|nr:MOP flippase family protein [Cohnella sp. AR92]RUS45289.1 colanic acid exporter [Cohnella sp. AR92]
MSLRQQGAKATKWTALSMIYTTVFQFLQLIVLSRMLTPEDYGIMGMVMVVVGVAVAFGDMGVTNIVFHKQDISRDQLSGIYLVNLISGTGVFILMLLSSPLMAMLFQESRVTAPLYLVSVVFLLTPIGQLYQALLQKEVRFRTLALFDIASSTSAFITAFILASLGYGVYALVWSQIINLGLKSICCFMVGVRKWKLSYSYRRQELVEYIRFGSYQIGEKLIHFLSSNFDYILIGRFFGAEILGMYSFAYNLVIMPVLKINPVLSQVAMPLLAKIQSRNEQLKVAYYQMLRILSMVNAPIYAGLIATAPYLIPLVFGDKWESAIVYVQILAVMGYFRSMISPVSSLLVAIGRVDLGFKWTLVLMLVMVPSIAGGAYLGETLGVAIAFVGLQFTFFLLKYAWIMRHLFNSTLLEYLLIGLPAVTISTLMGGTVALIPMMKLELTPIVILALQILTGTALYALMNWRFNRSAVDYILELTVLRGRRSGINVAG